MGGVRQDGEEYEFGDLPLLAGQPENHAGDDELLEQRQSRLDPEGRYLYFLSDRSYNAVPDNFDFEVVYPETTRVYAVTLRRDLASPFAPQSDEVKIENPNPNPPGPVASAQAARKPAPSPF